MSLRGVVTTGGAHTGAPPVAGVAPPCLLPIGNRPIVLRVLDDLREAGVSAVAVTVDEQAGEPVRALLGDGAKCGLAVTYVSLPDGLGAGHAVRAAAPVVGDGPCVVHSAHGLAEHPLADEIDDVSSGRCGAVAWAGGPAILGPAVLAALAQARPSWHGTLEIADALDAVERDGAVVRRPEAAGWWEWDGTSASLLEGNRRVLDRLEEHAPAPATPGVDIEGRVRVHPTAVVTGSKLRGPVVVGAGAVVRDSYLGPYTAVGDGATVDGAEIEDSILMAFASVANLSERLAGCILGRGARISRRFALPRANRVWLGDGGEVVLA